MLSQSTETTPDDLLFLAGDIMAWQTAQDPELIAQKYAQIELAIEKLAQDLGLFDKAYKQFRQELETNGLQIIAR